MTYRVDYFTRPYAWAGGAYEIAIELGPRSDERLLMALRTVWECPPLDGCYLRQDLEPTQQPRVSPSWDDVELERGVFGLARLPGGEMAPCGAATIREDHGPDWLDFFLPTGSLEEIDPRVAGYPFEENSSQRDWREPIDEWLMQIGRRVFERVPFALALIGFEALGQLYAEQLAATGPPEDRWVGYLWPRGDHLEWYPANRWDR